MSDSNNPSPAAMAAIIQSIIVSATSAISDLIQVEAKANLDLLQALPEDARKEIVLAVIQARSAQAGAAYRLLGELHTSTLAFAGPVAERALVLAEAQALRSREAEEISAKAEMLRAKTEIERLQFDKQALVASNRQLSAELQHLRAKTEAASKN